MWVGSNTYSMAEEGTTGIQAIDRTFGIVEAMIELEGAGVTELANHVDLPKSTVHHHLLTLERAGYVVRENGEYRTGLKFLRAGERTRGQHALYQVAHPEVEKLAEKTDEISGLMVEEHGEGVFIYRDSGSEAAHIDTGIGDRVPSTVRRSEKSFWHTSLPTVAMVSSTETAWPVSPRIRSRMRMSSASNSRKSANGRSRSTTKSG